HDWATYTYPLATTVDQGPIDETTTGRFSLSLEAKSETPIVGMESPSHADEFVMVAHSERYQQASLEVDGGDLSRDLVVAYRLERPQSGIDMIASRQSGEDGYFLMTITAGKELEQHNQGMDYVFLLDISGSMANDGKLGTSRKSIEAFVAALEPADRFEVLSFNLAPTPLFEELRAADESAHELASEYLRSQQARGGTVLRPALQTAYRYRDADRQLNVVILSDGMTEPTEQQQLLQLIASRPAGTRVFCIGVGNEINRPLLRQMAEQAGGLSAFLSRGDDFQRQANAFRRKLLRPSMTSLKLNFSGVDVYDVEPQQLPDLYHGSPVRVYGRYRGEGPATIGFSAEVLGKPLTQTFETSMPAVEGGNPEIERTWAWHRVQRLLNEERSSGNAGMLKQQIVRLCEDYSIASQYASFLVLENDAEYKRWAIERRNEVRIGRDRRARETRRERLRELRDQTLARLGPQLGDNAPQEANQIVSATPRPTTGAPIGPPPNPSSGRNFNFSDGGGGGGAIDPLSGVALLTLAGMGAWSARRTKRAGPS
ncbi:MAG: VWA domain-containing protein, partial [Planctomycetota bacterium]